MTDYYTNPLSLTSQFFFCGLPLRLDSYRGCAFQCSFCYARYRGGNNSDAAVLPADPDTLRRIFDRAFSDERGQPEGLISQFLWQRVPIHFGGMSDPFQPAERTFSVAGFWVPEGSVDRWLNSHSRIGHPRENAGTIKEHIRLRWNDPVSTLSPASFYGVDTPSGFRVYRWTDEAQRL